MATQDFSSIGGSLLLDQLRQSEQQKQAAIRQNQLSGVNLASAELGNVFGRALGGGLQKAGVIKDPQAARAQAVDTAVKASADAISGQDFETPFAKRIAQGEALSANLRAAGLTTEADKADSILDQLRVQALEFRKLEGETAKLEQPPEVKDEIPRLQKTRDTLTAQLETLDPGSPAFKSVTQKISETNARINKLTTITGRTEQDVGLTKSTQNKLQDFIQVQQGKLDNLAQAADNFNPDDFTLLGKAEGGLLALQDKVLGSNSLTADQKRDLARRTSSTQALIGNLNAYVQEITGAAVGTSGKGLLRDSSEEGRIRRFIPDPDNDSPTQIATKLANFTRLTRGVQARALAAAAANDLSLLATPLDQWITEPDKPSASETRAEARRLLGL